MALWANRCGSGAMDPALPYRRRASQGSRGTHNGCGATGNGGVSALGIEYLSQDSMKSKIRIQDTGTRLLSN